MIDNVCKNVSQKIHGVIRNTTYLTMFADL